MVIITNPETFHQERERTMNCISVINQTIIGFQQCLPIFQNATALAELNIPLTQLFNLFISIFKDQLWNHFVFNSWLLPIFIIIGFFAICTPTCLCVLGGIFKYYCCHSSNQIPDELYKELKEYEESKKKKQQQQKK